MTLQSVTQKKNVAIRVLETQKDCSGTTNYPEIGELVIIYRADNTNPNVPRLTEWFLSPQGQGLVRDVGYVPK